MLFTSVPYQIGRPWCGQYRRDFSALNAFRWLDQNTLLFGIGSCFANNVLRWIAQYHIRTATPCWGMHYNPYTILNELNIACHRMGAKITWKAYNRTGKIVYIDALRHTIQASSLAELEETREQIRSVSTEAFQKSTAFVITLGLSEIWEQYDDSTKKWTVINRAPPTRPIEKPYLRSRFLSVEETKEIINNIVSTIQSHKRTSAPIVFTVSPIPLKTTTSQLDVQSANLRSKAVLLSALQEYLEAAPKNVSYFPAYEIFFGGPRSEMLWQHDLRHPRADAIEFVCRQFINCFACDPLEFPEISGFTVPQV